MKKTQRRSAQGGFSLIELLIVVLVFTVIMGAVFSQIDIAQKRAHTEEIKTDALQTAREFMDQMVRDIHQSGFPNAKMYAAGVLTAPPENDPNNAVGLVTVSPTQVMFEGDVDGKGSVDSVTYVLITDTTAAGNQNCPCLRRGTVVKAAGVPPAAQAPLLFTQVENVTVVAGGAPLFTFYDRTGAVVPVPASGLTKTNFDPYDTTDPLNQIWSVQIQMDVQAAGADIQTGQRPRVVLSSTAQVTN
jgi:prepilin-type N-terminal cleavage/methylation domain-containing protein